MRVTDIQAADIPALLRLNQSAEAETSALTEGELRELVQAARFALRSHNSKAMILVLDETATFYESPNYLWFKNRHQNFHYVDRIIVDQSLRGQGAGRALYQAVFDKIARIKVSARSGVLGCEVNMLPDNPASHAFHKAIGFKGVGTAILRQDKQGRPLKVVAYYEKQVCRAS